MTRLRSRSQQLLVAVCLQRAPGPLAPRGPRRFRDDIDAGYAPPRWILGHARLESSMFGFDAAVAAGLFYLYIRLVCRHHVAGRRPISRCVPRSLSTHPSFSPQFIRLYCRARDFAFVSVYPRATAHNASMTHFNMYARGFAVSRNHCISKLRHGESSRGDPDGPFDEFAASTEGVGTVPTPSNLAYYANVR